MLKLENLDYSEWSVVWYQRSTVIISELVLVLALKRYCLSFASDSNSYFRLAFLLCYLNAGLLIVDHIHFQYNGFLLGILILALSEARNENFIYSAILFSALLNFKHIFLYISPAFFVYFLRAYCTGDDGFRYSRFLKLSGVVSTVFGLSFGYFALSKHNFLQVISRLFPFKRGLVHAYWAANFWAVYTFADRVVTILAPHIGLEPANANKYSPTRGLVKDVDFNFLPNISPRTSLLVTLASIVVPLYLLWKSPSYKNFLRSLILCAFSSFIFGWHVHEKAILIILIPYA